jgi:hypothetical protein
MTSLSSTQKGKKNLGESISKNNNNNKISYSISHKKKKKKILLHALQPLLRNKKKQQNRDPLPFSLPHTTQNLVTSLSL